MKYTLINSRTIDQWVENGWEWGRPISHETFEQARAGRWQMLLTPTKPVPREWFGVLRGARVLGLACGGGQQMPLFSALGAQCTVLDFSEKQLESERMVARREHYDITLVHADMTEPLPFESDSFDLIFHPVSNCYIEDVYPVWRECFRVLRSGGALLAGLDNGLSYAFDESCEHVVQKLPFNPLKDPALYQKSVENGDGIQFSHTIEEQIGGQLKAGLRLTDVYQDTDGSSRLHDFGVPTFFATRAVKPSSTIDQ